MTDMQISTNENPIHLISSLSSSPTEFSTVTDISCSPVTLPPPMVFISIERLQALEKLEQSLPTMIEQAIQENKKKNLSRLHEKDKQNPESVNLRVKRYAARHKETLNARRRAKREQKKKAMQETNNQVVYQDTSAPAGGSPIPPANFATLAPHLDVITVRFDN